MKYIASPLLHQKVKDCLQSIFTPSSFDEKCRERLNLKCMQEYTELSCYGLLCIDISVLTSGDRICHVVQGQGPGNWWTVVSASLSQNKKLKDLMKKTLLSSGSQEALSFHLD